MNRSLTISTLIPLIVVIAMACAPSSLASTPTVQSASPTAFASLTPRTEPTPSSTPLPAVTENVIPVTSHSMIPADDVPAPGKLIFDVESSGTGPEGRAPYGDSYKLNRFERPFLQDMTYVPDLDIYTFGLSQDADWYYISIELVGNDPNNSIGIDYGVEIDLNADGFGDYVIWAHPPYTPTWDTSTVEVFEDSDQDTGGLSSLQSDAVFDGNGYDTPVFDGGTSQNDDPDLAWVRMNDGQRATIQFAFKRSLTTSSSFMMGVIADAGLKDVSNFDYNDRFEEADAGSPVRDKRYYPLGSLYAVDNSCWEAYNIDTTGYEPKLCPVIVQPVSEPPADEDQTDEDQNQDQMPPAPSCNPVPNCGAGGYDPVTCRCQ